MFDRATGSLIVLFWLATLGWLVAHDMVPGWTAQEPPLLVVSEWLKTHGRQVQYAIEAPSGRVGTIWSTHRIDEFSVQRDDVIWIDQIPGLPDLGPLRISAISSFRSDGRLDEITFKISGNQLSIRLHGERFHSDFSFELSSGPLRRTFKIPLEKAGALSGALNPFGQLAGLRVGQRWRMQAFNPLAAVTGIGREFIPMLVEVTGEEEIRTIDGMKMCKIVECEGVLAWVDEHGQIEKQQITLPVGGMLQIRRERFSGSALRAARRHTFRF